MLSVEIFWLNWVKSWKISFLQCGTMLYISRFVVYCHSNRLHNIIICRWTDGQDVENHFFEFSWRRRTEIDIFFTITKPSLCFVYWVSIVGQCWMHFILFWRNYRNDITGCSRNTIRILIRYFSVTADGVTYSFGVFYVELVDYFHEGKGATAWIASILVGVTLCSGNTIHVPAFLANCLVS